jgi:hypothetical protein
MKKEFENFQSGKHSYFCIVGIILKIAGVNFNSLEVIKDLSIQEITVTIKETIEKLCITSLQDFSKL